MTTLLGTIGVGRATLPSREDIRAMLRSPAVAITAAICATVVVLAFVVGLVFLAYHGRSTEALAAAVVTPVVTALVAVLQRQKAVEAKLDTLTSKVDATEGRR